MAVGSDILHSLAEYLKAQAKNAIVTTGLYMIGFAITGVPWWLLTGFLCGVLHLIPYLGSVLALAIAILLRWFTADDWVPLTYVFGIWLTIQIVDGFVLSPRAAGRAGVSPLLSIPLVLVAGLIFGPLGAILAVPAVAVILIVYRASKRGADSP